MIRFAIINILAVTAALFPVALFNDADLPAATGELSQQQQEQPAQQTLTQQQQTQQTSNAAPPIQQPSMPAANGLNSDLNTVYHSENQFSIKLVAAVAANRDANFVVSPFGVYECLNWAKAMVNRESDAEISNALGLAAERSYATELAQIRASHLPAMAVADPFPNQFPNQFQPPGENPPGTETVNAPRLSPFVSQNVFVFDSQLQLAAGVAERVISPFRTATIGVDWTNVESVKGAENEVNRIFAEATSGRLQDLSYTAPELEAMSATLVNLCYFNANWSDSFSEAATQPALFTTVDAGGSQQIEVDYMRDSGREVFYHECEQFQLVELAYENSPMVMVLLLPARESSDADVLNSLNDTGCLGPRATRPQMPQKVRLQIPKFEFKTKEIDLNSVCNWMGINRIFAPGCGLESLFAESRPMFISKAVQNAFIRVDEKGTEAAAITELQMLPYSAAPPQKTKSFVADRPFLFFIVDTQGGIYFAGRVADPTAEN